MSNDRSPRRVTLLDVAAEAGVSRATASLVARGSSLVADDTRDRVETAMQNLGYVYDRRAASLRTGRSLSIGLVVSELVNPFIVELAVGIETGLESSGYMLLLANSEESAPRQSALLRMLLEHGSDGIILCPAQGTSPSMLSELAASKVPFVLTNRYVPGFTASYIGSDDRNGARTAAEHLFEHGCRQVVFFGGPTSSSARRDRERGVTLALEAAGRPPVATPSIACGVRRDEAFAAALRLLDDPERPDGIVCYNDVVAFAAMAAAETLGLVVGSDVHIVGFDDIADAAVQHPPLTTVGVGPRQLGLRVAELLLRRMADPQARPERILLTSPLTARRSCGCHPDSSPPAEGEGR